MQSAPTESGLRCEDASRILVDGALHLGVELSHEQIDHFIRYCCLLSGANQRVNLTAVRTPAGIMRILFLDSLTILSALPESPPWRGGVPLRLVDVGSGAGIPGLPLKLARPEWSVTLVESTRKKARFLQETVDTLELTDVTVSPARAEQLAAEPAFRDRADLCVARAVAPLASLVELCGPFVRPGGLLVFPKGADSSREVEEAREAARRLKVRYTGVVRVQAGLEIRRAHTIVMYEKVGGTPREFPRRMGIAQATPLGGGNPGQRR